MSPMRPLSLQVPTFTPKTSVPVVVPNPSTFSAAFTASVRGQRGLKAFASGQALMAQGLLSGGTSADLITHSRGSLVASTFYANMDTAQGTILCHFTPEWAYNDNLYHTIYAVNGGFFVRHNGANNKLTFQVALRSIEVDISTWTPGTTYAIVCRWDTNNTLDGTNYMCLSINDVHTFGATIAPAPAAPDGNCGIGCTGSATFSASGIIEGLTVLRRVIFDGTYGINAGYGDEIANHYNGGSGRDICYQMGSWDVCFALPVTRTSFGAVTITNGATGNAWSHPHSSNVITPADGFMLSTAWANWTALGLPASASVLAASERIYQGGYKFTNAGLVGYKYTLTVSAGADYVVRALVHSDTNSKGRLQVYDETGAAVITQIDGTTTSTRTAPDVLQLSFEVPTGSTSISIRLYNEGTGGTLYCHQVEVLPNMFDNPSMEGTYTGTPLVPPGSGFVVSATATSAKETTITHSTGASWHVGPFSSGSYSLAYLRKSPGNTKFHMVGGFLYYAVLTGGRLYVNGMTRQDNNGTSAALESPTTGLGSWKYNAVVGNRNNNYDLTWDINNTAGYLTREAYLDDYFMVVLDDVTLSVTAASYANSLEGAGLRVDGRDILQPTISAAQWSKTFGIVSLGITPRHSSANAIILGDTGGNGPCLFGCNYNLNDYLLVYYTSATNIRVKGLFNGTTVQGDWASPGLVAGQTYRFVLSYQESGNLVLAVDGVVRVSASGVPAGGFNNLPTEFRLGGNGSADVGDVIISA